MAINNTPHTQGSKNWAVSLAFETINRHPSLTVRVACETDSEAFDTLTRFAALYRYVGRYPYQDSATEYILERIADGCIARLEALLDKLEREEFHHPLLAKAFKDS